MIYSRNNTCHIAMCTLYYCKTLFFSDKIKRANTTTNFQWQRIV